MGSGRARSSQHSKKHRLRSVPDDGRPTVEEYANMPSADAFVVDRDDGVTFKFEKGQIALILPHGANPDEQHDRSTYWVARIQEIRSRITQVQEGDSIFESDDVWVHVQWFYSGKDVSDVVKSFDCTAVGAFERIFSDHHDFVPAGAFEEIIPMFKFDENNHSQHFIPSNCFYRRYTFEYQARKLQPKPGVTHCICKQPYNPNDCDPESLSHFCPRPSCRKAYHHRCLAVIKSWEKLQGTTIKKPSTFSGSSGPVRTTRSARKHVTPVRRPACFFAKAITDEEVIPTPEIRSIFLSSRSLHLLACSPDTDETLDLQALVPHDNDSMDTDTSDTGHSSSESPDSEEDIPPSKNGKVPPPKKQIKLAKPKPSLDSVLATISQDLLTVATQPLVRGGAFVAGGVAGNIGMVTEARRLVYTALQMGGGQGAIPEDWKNVVFGKDRELVGIEVRNAVVYVMFEDGTPVLPSFVCPHCKSAI